MTSLVIRFTNDADYKNDIELVKHMLVGLVGRVFEGSSYSTASNGATLQCQFYDDISMEKIGNPLCAAAQAVVRNAGVVLIREAPASRRD